MGVWCVGADVGKRKLCVRGRRLCGCGCVQKHNHVIRIINYIFALDSKLIVIIMLPTCTL